MPAEEPAWWYGRKHSWQALALAPAGLIYGALAKRRLNKGPRYRSRFPVLCVGNFTVGGTGKTPLSIALADLVRGSGYEPVFLTRGYGGQAHGPLIVDPHHATAAETGDEPLLLARAAPTVVSRDRVAGARLIEKAFPGPTVIIMDDGLQNPALAKTLTLALVDATRRWGNGRCLPAGPLRAPLAAQLARADAIVMTGKLEAAADASALAALTGADRRTRTFAGPVLRSHVAPAGDLNWLNGAEVVAFAGIANPRRFYDLLAAQGAKIVSERSYPDHHPFREEDAAALIAEATGRSARLVTTEKDFVRLYGLSGERGRLRDLTLPVPVTMAFGEHDHAALDQIVRRALGKPAPTLDGMGHKG